MSACHNYPAVSILYHKVLHKSSILCHESPPHYRRRVAEKEAEWSGEIIYPFMHRHRSSRDAAAERFRRPTGPGLYISAKILDLIFRKGEHCQVWVGVTQPIINRQSFDTLIYFKMLVLFYCEEEQVLFINHKARPWAG